MDSSSSANITSNSSSSYVPEGGDDGPSEAMLHKIDIVYKTMLAMYCVLLLGSLYVLFIKLRASRKLRTGVLYILYTIALASTRIGHLSTEAEGWYKIIDTNGGLATYIFVDVLPELFFMSIFILMTITLAIAWTKSRNLKVFKDSTLMITHTVIAAIIFMCGGFMCVAIRTKNLDISTAIRWEAVFVASMSGIAVGISGAIGFGFYYTVRRSAKKMDQIVNTSKSALMRQLIVLIVLTLVAFIFKSVWALSLSLLIVEHGEVKLAYILAPFYVACEIIPIAFSVFLQWKTERSRTPGGSAVSKTNRIGPTNTDGVSFSAGTSTTAPGGPAYSVQTYSA